jgi:hypothetical protein
MYLRILHDKVGLKEFLFGWVLYAPSINQKNERVSDSKLRLTTLMR